MVDTVKTYTGTVVPYAHSVHRFCCSADTDNTQGVYTFTIGGTRTSANGVGNYIQKIARGVCATTALVANETVFEWEPDNFEVYSKDIQCTPNKEDCYDQREGYWCRFSPPITDNPEDPSSYSTDVALNLAKMKYLKDISKKRSRLMSLVNAKETSETVRLFQGAAKLLKGNISGYIRDVIKRTSTRRRTTRGSVEWRRVQRENLAIASDAWLSFSFGIRPLVADLDELATILNKAYNPDPNHLQEEVKGVGKDEQKFALQPRSSGSGYFSLKWEVQKTSSVICVLLGKVDIGPMYNTLAQQIGVSLESWAPTVWECVPYSFLVDYFLNVGDVIEAYSMNLFGLKWTQRTYIKLRELEVVNGRNAVAYSPNLKSVVSSAGSAYWCRRYIDRNIFTDSLMPSLAWRLPGITSTKWCNIAALLGGANANYRKRMTGPNLVGVRI